MTAIRPFQALLDITDRCNQSCLHCFVDANSRNQDLPYGKFINIIDQLVDSGVLWITLTGGEPMMHPYFFDMIEYLSNSKDLVDFTVFTNGTLWSEGDVIRLANQVKDFPKFWIQVSMDGYDNETYSSFRKGGEKDFLNATNAIKLFRKYGISVSVSTSVSNFNIDYALKIGQFVLSELACVDYLLYLPLFPLGRGTNLSLDFRRWGDFIRDLTLIKRDCLWGKMSDKIGVSVFNFFEIAIPLIERNLAREVYEVWDMPTTNLSHLNRIGKKQGLCQSGGNLIHITSDGAVYPCTWAVNVEKFQLGNLYEDNLQQILNQTGKGIIDFFCGVNSNDLDGHCPRCEFKENCGGGCRVYSYVKNKDLYGKDDRCPYHQKFR